MEDQVTFASEKTEGQYIHTSSRIYRQVGITLHEDELDLLLSMTEVLLLLLYFTSYEINASATESGYTIKSHYCAMPNEQDSIKVRNIKYNSCLLYMEWIFRVAVLFVCFIGNWSVTWWQKDLLLTMVAWL